MADDTDDPFEHLDDPFQHLDAAPQEQPQGTAPQEPVSYGGTAVRGVASGFLKTLFGGGELVGRGLKAVGADETGQRMIDTAQQGVQQVNEQLTGDKAQHPYVSLFGELAGASVIPGTGVAKLGMGTLKAAALAGTAGGGLTGLFEPTTAKTPEEFWTTKAEQVGGGAATGAVAAPALSAGARGLALGLRSVANWAVERAGPDIMKQPAVREMLKLMGRDGVKAQDLLDVAALTPDKPLALVDLGAANIKGKAGQLARAADDTGDKPNSRTVMNSLRDRDAGAYERTAADVGNTLGRETVDDDKFKALVEARSAASKPLYDKSNEGGSIAPLKDQYEHFFKEAGRIEAEARQKVADAQNRLTQAAARKSQAGDDVYLNSAANERTREAEKALAKAQSDLKTASETKTLMLDNLRLVQSDIATGQKGAVIDPYILNLLKNEPEVRRGVRRGLEIERLNANAEGRPIDWSEYALKLDEHGAPVLDAEGNETVHKVPNMRILSVVKEGLDAMLWDTEALRNQLTGELTKKGRAVANLRDGLLQRLKRLNPDYEPALEAWHGGSKSLEAYQIGRKILDSRDALQVARDVKDMAPGDLEFYKLGAARTLTHRAGERGAAGDETLGVIPNQNARLKLRTAFASDEEFSKFVNSIDAEHKMFATHQKLFGGSPTAERVADDSTKNALGDAAHGLFSAALGHGWTATTKFVNAARKALDPLAVEQRRQLDVELAKLFSEPISAPGSRVGEALRHTASPPGRGNDALSRAGAALRSATDSQGLRPAAPYAVSAAVAARPKGSAYRHDDGTTRVAQ